MKTLLLLLTLVSTFNSFALAVNLKNLNMQIESEIHSQRDKNYDLVGEESLITLKPQYWVTDRMRLGVGITYMERQIQGTEKFSESKNRDHLQEIYYRIRYKHLSEKEGDPIELRYQFRYYQDQDPHFIEKYGSGSNYQARVYFGKKLLGGLYISRWNSYLRYKKYQLNEYAGDRSRNYELRARVAPTYRFKYGYDLGLTFTYNHIFQNDNAHDENVAVDLSLRKQIDRQMAAMLRVGYPWLGKNERGVLSENTVAHKDIQYALNFQVNVF